MPEFTERAIQDASRALPMQADTIRQWASDASQQDRYCMTGYALERSEGFMECLAILRKCAHSYCMYWCPSEDEHCEDCIELSDTLDRYKDVKTD